jgi:hypothetical protein
MVFIKAHRKQLLLAGSLAAVTAFTVTACGGGAAAAPPQGAAPGKWTQAEVSQFTAAAGSGGSASQESCATGYVERDMSFSNAMAVVSVDPASGPGLSVAQIKAALVSKYGTAEGDAINAQYGQVVTDSNNNCSGSAASSTARVAAPVPTADPAAAPVASTPAPAATTPALVATTPAAAASPVGTWNVAYTSAPASILGQYSFTEDGGFYYMTTKSLLKVPDGNCSLPAGIEIGSFSASGGIGNYSGTENLYEPGTCAFAGTTAALTATVSGNTIMLLVPDQQSVTLTRAGSAASSAVASASVPSTDCIVPDVIGAGLNGHIAAAAAENKVSNTCPPVGYHVVTVLTVSGPAGTPQGELWKESPAAGSSEPPGSTVTLYFQP